MSESTVQLDIPLLLPEIDDSRDACVAHLENTLINRTGIQHVHVKHEDEPAQLCLHYDPNLVSLTAVRRLAQQDTLGRDGCEMYSTTAIRSSPSELRK